MTAWIKTEEHARMMNVLEKRIADLEAEVCSMNDAGHKLFDENERLREMIKDMGTGFDDATIDAAIKGN